MVFERRTDLDRMLHRSSPPLSTSSPASGSTSIRGRASAAARAASRAPSTSRTACSSTGSAPPAARSTAYRFSTSSTSSSSPPCRAPRPRSVGCRAQSLRALRVLPEAQGARPAWLDEIARRRRPAPAGAAAGLPGGTPRTRGATSTPGWRSEGCRAFESRVSCFEQADRARYELPSTAAYTARRAARVGRRLLSKRRLRAS